MGYTNSFSGIIKVLEKPTKIFINDQIPIITFRGEVPQSRNKCVIAVQFWGKLVQEVAKCYQVNDYLLIEGHISIQIKKSSTSNHLNCTHPFLIVSKVYPLKLKTSLGES